MRDEKMAFCSAEGAQRMYKLEQVTTDTCDATLRVMDSVAIIVSSSCTP
jgi:hypothetical protein